MNNKDNKERYKLPKWAWFLCLFLGSFLPWLFGKCSAVLAGMILTLYLLDLIQGRKKYILAIVLPIVTCIFIRLASNSVYLWVVDTQAREEMSIKVNFVINSLLHYFQRIWETICGINEAFTGFYETKEFQTLKPVAGNIQFVLILLVIGVCFIRVFRKKERI